jgi:alkanesulfonate monooxygenase SsuD/methylene tetrahydromethanopterin reductase-like flavin-dependent oxidoreductase (luciferase family)
MNVSLNPSYQMSLGKSFPEMSDTEFFKKEVHLAELAEPLGFSNIWCVEHHFDGQYSMCPDNLQVLTYLAGRTETIGLTTGAIILPWHLSPLRIAERISMLDILSDNRLTIGLGRGLSKIEYATFGIPMDESRERWHEALDILLQAQDTGHAAEYNGQFYTQAAAAITPWSGIPASDRLVEVATSEESVTIAAKLGARMATFLQFSIGQHASLIDLYRNVYEETHHKPAPPPTLTEFLYCGDDSAEAAEMQRKHCAAYFFDLVKHYDFGGDHFANLKGYQNYAEISEVFKSAGMDNAAAGYVEANTYGTPAEIVEKIRARRELVGDYHLNVVFSYGGIPFDKAEASMRRFASEVIPEVAKMRSGAAAASA